MVFGEVHLVTIRRIVIAISPNEVKKGNYQIYSTCDIKEDFQKTLTYFKDQRYIILYDGPPMVAET